MSKDLVALLRRPYGNLTFAEKQEVANLIEELETENAKLKQMWRKCDEDGGNPEIFVEEV